MVSALLHVEDDFVLRAVVQLAFENLGFRGRIVRAETVQQATERLDEPGDRPFDLIISDMHLPDGSGLDVVRLVRSNQRTSITPIVILSSDVDPKRISGAYALGANVYLDKSPRGSSLHEVVQSLYQHWIVTAVLPRPGSETPAQKTTTRAIMLRARYAQLYQRLAERFGDDRSEAAFWLSRALAESNLTNVLDFMRRQLTVVELPLDRSTNGELTAMQDEASRALDATERQLDRAGTSRIDAYRSVLDLLLTMNIDTLARTIGQLFPVMPVAMAALRDFLIGTLRDVVAWVDLHTQDAGLQERTTQLRARLETLTGAIAAQQRSA